MAAVLLSQPAVGAEGPEPVPVGLSGSGELSRRNEKILTRVPAAEFSDAAAARAIAPASRDEMLWAFDFGTHEYYRLRATLVLQSRLAWFYVEEGLELPPGAVDRLAETFSDTVYPAVVDAYGPEIGPGIDENEAITVLLLDIRDPLHDQAAPETYYTGYFDPINERRQEDLDRENSRAKSNEREMLYVDAASPTDPLGVEVQQTLAHELAHLVQWFHDPEDQDWLVEGLSGLAVYLSGLGHPRAHVLAYLEAPDVPMVTWDGTPRDYGKAYLFLLYLHEQAGEADRRWLRRLVANPADGMGSLAASAPFARPIPALLRDFALALHLDDSGLAEGRFGFRSLDLQPGPTTPEAFPVPKVAPLRMRDADRVRLEYGPWSVRVEALDAGRMGLDLELTPFTSVCAGAARRPVEVEEDVQLDCPVGGQPVVWRFHAPPASRLAAPVLVAIANGSDLPTEIVLQVMPTVGPASLVDRLYLPAAFARR